MTSLQVVAWLVPVGFIVWVLLLLRPVLKLQLTEYYRKGWSQWHARVLESKDRRLIQEAFAESSMLMQLHRAGRHKEYRDVLRRRWREERSRRH